MSTAQLVANLDTYIVNPVLALIFAAGLVVFFWGAIEFLGALNQMGFGNKEDGKRHMFYGLIGMFIMVAAYALLQFIASNVCGSLNNCYPASTGTYQSSVTL